MSEVRGRAQVPFRGRVSNVSPHMAAGMVDQDNICNAVPGTLQVRKGNRIIAIDNAAATTASDIIGVASIVRPEARILIYHCLDGSIRMARNPS